MKISLNDLLQFTISEMYMCNAKLNHKASDADPNNPAADPLNVFLEDPEKLNKEWLLKRTTYKYFKDGQDIALNFVRITKFKKNIWLLASIMHITKRSRGADGMYSYNAEVMEEYSKYFGRVVIKYDKDNQNPYVDYRKLKDSKVLAILPEKCDIKKAIELLFD